MLAHDYDHDDETLGFGDGLVKLEMPDLPPGFDWDMGVELPNPPAACANLPEGIFQSLCARMMDNIHKNHGMTNEERDACLRKVVFPIPGEPAGRTLDLMEDNTGVYTAGATGSVLWPAAVGLIGLLDRVVGGGSAWRPESAVELGAGLGAVGLFLAVHKGLRVTLTDTPESLPLLKRNIVECAAGAVPKVCRAEARPLKWGDASHMRGLGKFDAVIGSDITYRPECLQDLLATAAALLAPGGRVYLSLQDRRGERGQLEAACSAASSPLEILRCDSTEVRESAASFDETGDDGVVNVWLCELRPKGGCTPAEEERLSGGLALPAPLDNTPVANDCGGPSFLSPEDIEAEFERITGIRPEKLMPGGVRPCSRKEAVAQASGVAPQPAVMSTSACSRSEASGKVGSSMPNKHNMVQQLLDRGLGDYLCELDEELSAAIGREAPAVRPRTAKQKQAFAAAFYAGEPLPPEAFNSSSGADPLRVGVVEEERGALARAAAVAAGASGLLRRGNRDETFEEQSGHLPQKEPAAAAEASATSGGGDNSGNIARARLCVGGLEWHVDIDEAARQVSAVVTFDEAVWVGLQGFEKGSATEGAKAFREAVDFELAASELRVLHAGAAVLELELPRPVDAAAAAAKICSRRRRVTVRAPLASGGSDGA